VYSIAAALSEAGSVLVARITRRILFPVLSRVREEGTDSLREVFYRSRLALDLAVMPALGALAMTGHYLIDLLYDPRYAAAGWMLELLAIRVGMSCLAQPSEMCMVALGHPRYSFFQNGARLLWVGCGIMLGHHLFGLRGVLWAIALSELPSVVVQWIGLRRARVLVAHCELRSLGLFAIGVAAGLLVRAALG
jgi:O-antigen/teichoic acid export membrane protein